MTGGSVVQSTGTSTTNVMSQKAFTDLSFGIGQKWYDLTGDRVLGAEYTNNTNKTIFISIDTYGGDVVPYVDDIRVGMIASYGVFFPVQAGATYRTEGRFNLQHWGEFK